MWKTYLAAALTLMATGRAMTLAFLFQAGGDTAGAAPAAWTMPLLGDALIGLAAPVVALLLIRGKGLAAWVMVLLWSAVAIWDAASALVVHLTVPWSGFFMTQIFGWTMFPAAILMHVGIAVLVVVDRRRFLQG